MDCFVVGTPSTIHMAREIAFQGNMPTRTIVLMLHDLHKMKRGVRVTSKSVLGTSHLTTAVNHLDAVQSARLCFGDR